jgi:hypothetical protein
LINTPAGIPSPSASRRIIGSVNERREYLEVVGVGRDWRWRMWRHGGRIAYHIVT